MDKRAAFEAWRAERYAQTTSWCNELGEYPDEFTQGQWKAWKGALVAQPAASVEPSDEEIEALAHRVCTKYTHADDPSARWYEFGMLTLRQFARALLSRYGRPAGDAQPVRWVHTLHSEHDDPIAEKVTGTPKNPFGKPRIDYDPAYRVTSEPLYDAPVAAHKPDGGDTAHTPLVLGMRGTVFDPPDQHRAYTYQDQPGNVVAWKLGAACNEAAKASAGDSIDRGLGLLKALQEKGFGVFEIAAIAQQRKEEGGDHGN